MPAAQPDEQRYYCCARCGAEKRVLLARGYALSVTIRLPSDGYCCDLLESEHSWKLTLLELHRCIGGMLKWKV